MGLASCGHGYHIRAENLGSEGGDEGQIGVCLSPWTGSIFVVVLNSCCVLGVVCRQKLIRVAFVLRIEDFFTSLSPVDAWIRFLCCFFFLRCYVFSKLLVFKCFLFRIFFHFDVYKRQDIMARVYMILMSQCVLFNISSGKIWVFRNSVIRMHQNERFKRK